MSKDVQVPDKGLSKKAKALLKSLLVRDPEKRLGNNGS
jgi:hypothetical protein